MLSYRDHGADPGYAGVSDERDSPDARHDAADRTYECRANPADSIPAPRFDGRAGGRLDARWTAP